jgi:serine phosphatase RsbU (regulator of sigma subunit)
MPTCDGLEIEAHLIPARLGGGDFYMVVETDDGIAFVTMGVGLWKEGANTIELSNAGRSPVLLR